MAVKYIEIPTLRDKVEDYKKMITLLNPILEDPDHSFTFTFTNCKSLENTAIAFLGGVSNLVHKRYIFLKDSVIERVSELYKTNNLFYLNEFSVKQTIDRELKLLGALGIGGVGVSFDITTMTDHIKKTLSDCNFLSHFSGTDCDDTADLLTSGRFKIHEDNDTHFDEEELVLYLTEQWLPKDLVLLSPNLRGSIISSITEIFYNAHGHGLHNSKYKLNIVSCGSYDAKSQMLKLCVFDCGGGISQRVQEHIEDAITEEDALAWALRQGNTTNTDSVNKGMARGLGFSVLQQFLSVNQGNIDIITNSCRATIGQDKEYLITSTNLNFNGTMVSISIDCNRNRAYQYKGESFFS